MSLKLFAPPATITQDNTFALYHRQWLINAFVHVESRGNWKAYNKQEQAAGVIQIRPIMVRHINKISMSNFTLSDRFDSVKSIAMFDSLMSKRNPEYNGDLACNLWNAGIKYPKKQRVRNKVYKYKVKIMDKYLQLL